MKTLNLNDLGVQEMNAEEMRETEGGRTKLGEAFDNAKDAAGGVFFNIIAYDNIIVNSLAI